MKFPKSISTKQKKFLKAIYEDTYNKRKKMVGEKKARHSARAKFYEEAFKIFLEKENVKTINEDWKRKNIPRRKKINMERMINEDVDYKVYKIDGIKLIVSVEEKLLDRFKNSERKGLLRNMEDEFEQEILHKAQEKYSMRFSPDMYYVIKE